jgi:uncharacterized peroxidase-related enzyme
LPDRERAIVRYAVKLTRSPGAMRRGDVAALRAAGLSDLAVRDVALVASYFAFMNRMADGLGFGPDAEHRFSTSDP